MTGIDGTMAGAGSHGPLPLVSVDDLEPGMVVAEDVADQHGRLLLGGGTTLTERHLRAFQMWGIRSVRIRGADDEDAPVPPPLSAEQLAEAEERLRPHFRNCVPTDPTMVELFAYCALREAHRAIGQGSHG